MRVGGLGTVLAVCSMVLASMGSVSATAAPPVDEMHARLDSVPGLTVVGERPTAAGFRLLDLTFAQPSDHRDPVSPRFQQRLTLLYRGFDRPNIAYTSGYHLPTKVSQTEPTQLIDGNQLNIEHRFFSSSRPEPADWSDLDIWQAATDEHRIIEAFRQVLAEEWITTGASKGGMTAVYHRRFYPEDVEGTIAYVAPNDVDNDRDRYDEFLANVGTDPACRSALTALQREALLRRDEMLAKYQAAANSQGLTFDWVIGSLDKAFEATVFDTTFTFWQYRGEQDCSRIPATTASTDEISRFIDETVGFDTYSDQMLEKKAPYYYQAGTQLGWPEVSDESLADLLHHRDPGNPRGLVPRAIPMHFQQGAMADVDAWVRSAGSQLMFVNGQNDPWTAEPFRLGPGSSDSHEYVVSGGNHGSKIADLPAADEGEAARTVRRWGGVEQDPTKPLRLPGLDDRLHERDLL